MLLSVKSLNFTGIVAIIQNRTRILNQIAPKNSGNCTGITGNEPEIILRTAGMRAAHPLHISVGLPCGNIRRANYFVQT